MSHRAGNLFAKNRNTCRNSSQNVFKSYSFTTLVPRTGIGPARFAGEATYIKAKGGYTATETAAGASLQINPCTSVYGELGKLWANGGDSRVESGVQAFIGVKVQR